MELAIPSPADIGGRSFRNEPLFRTVAYDLSSLELRGLGVSGCEDQDGKETREDSGSRGDCAGRRSSHVALRLFAES